jgi:hypothetical protein
MWGWIMSVLVALIGGVGIWYYRDKLAQTAQIDGLVKANTQVLSDLSSLIATLAANANKAATKDLEDAKNVKTAAGAATFLNDSVPGAVGGAGISPFGIVYTSRNP